jgi:hypothetical protein
VNYTELDNKIENRMSISNTLQRKTENLVSCENSEALATHLSPSTLYGTYKSIFFSLF